MSANGELCLFGIASFTILSLPEQDKLEQANSLPAFSEPVRVNRVNFSRAWAGIGYE
jgi:hypothetical protein